MQDILDTPDDQPTLKKIFSPRSAYWGTFLGGPIALGYFLWYNFKTFGEPRKAIYAILLTIVFAVVINFSPQYIPVLANIPLLSTILMALGGQFAVRFGQANEISHHLAAGGEYQSGWITLLVGIISIIISLAIVFAIFALTSPDSLNGLLEEIPGL